MRQPVSSSTVGRTVVIGGYLLAVALAGRPVWLAVLLGAVLVLVWAAPILLAPPRRRSAAVPAPWPTIHLRKARPH